jgi:tetraacyldisaccharide 4'-kinase
MPLETPSWWYGKRGSLAKVTLAKVMPALLSPVAALYGRNAAARLARDPEYRSRLPVICVGNFTSGGGGKTPTAIALAGLLKALGRTPAFLTRGYGGSLKETIQVAGHDASEVGDEALLLAETAPTFVSADRPAGAKAIEQTDADVIVMDDGFQNPGLAKDLSLIVVDAGSGLGNCKVIPAGPLRAPLEVQIPHADALLIIGEGKKGDALIKRFEAAGKPALRAKIAPNCDPRWLTVLPTIGFAGIARPSKFFATLKSNGARLVASHGFGDHHRFTEKEARRLLDEAEAKKAMLVTTEKDWARLTEDADDEEESAVAELKKRSRPFPIVIAFDDEEAVKALLAETLENASSKLAG